MPVFTENSVKLIRLHNVSRINGTRYNSTNHTWRYIVIGFTKAQNRIHYYRVVLNHMLRMVKMDTSLTFSLVFQIVPVILEHTDEKNYIVMRLRMNSKAMTTTDEIVDQVMDKFNLVYGTDLKMARCNDRESIECFKRLFTAEYVQTDTQKSTPTCSPDSSPPQKVHALTDSCTEQQPKYALRSLPPPPPPPPMPTTLDLSLLSSYFALFTNDMPNAPSYTTSTAYYPYPGMSMNY